MALAAADKSFSFWQRFLLLGDPVGTTSSLALALALVLDVLLTKYFVLFYLR